MRLFNEQNIINPEVWGNQEARKAFFALTLPLLSQSLLFANLKKSELQSYLFMNPNLVSQYGFTYVEDAVNSFGALDFNVEDAGNLRTLTGNATNYFSPTVALNFAETIDSNDNPCALTNYNGWSKHYKDGNDLVLLTGDLTIPALYRGNLRIAHHVIEPFNKLRALEVAGLAGQVICEHCPLAAAEACAARPDVVFTRKGLNNPKAMGSTKPSSAYFMPAINTSV